MPKSFLAYYRLKKILHEKLLNVIDGSRISKRKILIAFKDKN